ncbi:MAG: hypothetical protein JNK85_17620 [Verrucomicrobiales bacterium]|nr:hypothetical protein [Verrucomicrobiales bacterium]
MFLRRSRSCWVLGWGLFLTLHGIALAQSGVRISSWRSTDGLPSSDVFAVSLDGRGQPVATHDADLPVSRLDGFHVQSVSNTVGAASRVYVSRSEQFWAAHPQGLQEQTGDGWILHPVSQIAAEYRARPLRAVRPIPLLPLDRHRVLVLLPDALLEFDAGENRTRTIRTASTRGIGAFNEINPGKDDSAWIAGANGLIRIPGPLRQIQPDTLFEEFVIPPELAVTDLQRPFENAAGEVVMAAEDSTTHRKLVLRWSRGSWQKWDLGGQNVRQAWGGRDNDLWMHTSGTVFRLSPEGDQMRVRNLLQVGRIADLAVDPTGVAWLATSDGLFRLASLPWRPAPRFPPESGAVLSIISDRRGRLIATTARGVHRQEGGDWKFLPFPPERLDEGGAPESLVCALPDGGLVIQSAAGSFVMAADGASRTGSTDMSRARVLGSLTDGRVVFLDATPSTGQLLVYDGRATTPLARLPEDVSRIGQARMMLQTRSGELWIGGDIGALVRRGDGWTVVDDPETGAMDGAQAGLELADGRLLFGGADAVREFDGRRWRTLRRGLDRVNGLALGRDGSIWVASGSGLYRYKDNSWLTLGDDEGLSPTTIHAVLEDGLGRLWAGTAAGLAVFDPSADTDPPEAIVAGADVPQAAAEARALFVVGGRDRWHYTTAGRLVFSSRLDNGPWSTWRPAGSVQFTNLAAGTHQFFVRAMDPSGNVQAWPASYDFTVALPWLKDARLVLATVVVVLLATALAVQAALSYSRLRRSYAEVERQVAERSAALEKANAELLHSHKMRALGTLAAGVAHDFNNLLSIIRGSAQLIEGNLKGDDKARQRVQRIKTAVDQGAGLVRAMLGYSRGAAAPRKELTVEEVVTRAIRLLEERLQCRIRFQNAPVPLPTVFAPPEMLQQIVLNLIQNADEAMDHAGTVTVELTHRLGPADEAMLKPRPSADYVVLAVRDTGIGIPQENLTRIFEPFFTTKAFSSRRGTGLGLSMVYEFAKELGAGIEVESALGTGSCFRILLPTGPWEPPEQAAPDSPAAVNSPPSTLPSPAPPGSNLGSA